MSSETSRAYSRGYSAGRHRTAEETKRWAEAFDRHARLIALIREAERALAMVPADREPIPGFLAELNRSIIAPLIEKLRKA